MPTQLYDAAASRRPDLAAVAKPFNKLFCAAGTAF
jgi:hypothetical protein